MGFPFLAVLLMRALVASFRSLQFSLQRVSVPRCISQNDFCSLRFHWKTWFDLVYNTKGGFTLVLFQGSLVPFTNSYRFSFLCSFPGKAFASFAALHEKVLCDSLRIQDFDSLCSSEN
ncbi:hypothetical protein C1646_676723, partial [Rhizophagus diaphanus]